jgi:hypothetical protein
LPPLLGFLSKPFRRAEPFFRPGRQCIANEADEQALTTYLAALAHAQAMDRPSVRAAAADQFATHRIVDTVLAAWEGCR